jgi:hypothetical protein
VDEAEGFGALLGPLFGADVEFPEKFFFVLTSRINESPEVSLGKVVIASALLRTHDLSLR